jgi:hypothetical protein
MATGMMEGIIRGGNISSTRRGGGGGGGGGRGRGRGGEEGEKKRERKVRLTVTGNLFLVGPFLDGTHCCFLFFLETWETGNVSGKNERIPPGKNKNNTVRGWGGCWGGGWVVGVKVVCWTLGWGH